MKVTNIHPVSPIDQFVDSIHMDPQKRIHIRMWAIDDLMLLLQQMIEGKKDPNSQKTDPEYKKIQGMGGIDHLC